MDETIARKINDAKSILIVAPTDIDFATIYAAISFGQTIKNKSVTILNDAITTNKLLIHKLKNFRFSALHTKATRSFTLVIDKLANKIKQSFIDETEERITLSLETKDNTFNPSSLIELKRSQINQDLIIILLKNTDQVKFSPKKYRAVLSNVPQEKIVYIFCDDPQQPYTFWAETIQKYADQTNFDEYSLTLLLASLIVECDLFASRMQAKTFDVIEKLVEKGAKYNDAYNVAANVLNFDEASYHVKEMQNVKNMGNGIYYSHIDDIGNLYSINPPYMPEIARFADCKVAFVIITKRRYHQVFVVNNKEHFDLTSIRGGYNGIGDDTFFYFTSKLDLNSLEQDIIRKLIAVTSGSLTAAQISESKDMDIPNPEPKFTQGLVATSMNPLAPAPAGAEPGVVINQPTPQPTIVSTTNAINSTMAIAEEC